MYLLLFAGLAFLPPATPEERALSYLSREVPAWSVKNTCYSCHNNANGARALLMAKRLKMAVPDKAVEDTSRWLARPQGWKHNGGEGPYNDKVLSTIQFAAALADGLETGVIDDRTALKEAAQLVASLQTQDGCWPIGDGTSIGSPATLGNPLAAVFARRVLHAADAKEHAGAIAKADKWIRDYRAKNVLDAAAVLWALADAEDDDAAEKRKACLELIRKGESKDGGWGPYVNSAPEPFDTAVVMLALLRQKETKKFADWVRRGRAFLIANQSDDGSWQETTRPAGGDSYAQRVSTTGWAMEALLASLPGKP
jgi:hypothetical protein